jgi:hypothetical protein
VGIDGQAGPVGNTFAYVGTAEFATGDTIYIGPGPGHGTAELIEALSDGLIDHKWF